MTRIVTIHPYNPDWPRQYEAYRAELTPILGENLSAIHHIGSTAVPGLAAKPIIDIMPLVHNLAQIELITPTIITLGYIAKGENGIPGRRYFRKGSAAHHLVHVHIYQPDHPEVAHHLDFRDYLRAHAAARDAYAALKRDLAARFRTDPPAYTNAKTDFIRRTAAKAQPWRQQMGGRQ